MAEQHVQLWRDGVLRTVRPIRLEPGVTPPGEAMGGMGELAGLFLDRLSPEELQRMASFAKSGPVSVGSICSGTDVASHCHEAFVAAMLQKTGAELSVEMKFACEKSWEKANFLAKLHPKTKLIFKDAEQLGERIAWCTKTQANQAVPSVTGICAGFPCTDISRLNKHSGSSSNMQCTSSQTLRTGAVFGHILRYLQTHAENTSFAILENVATLAVAPKAKGVQIGPSNSDTCVYDLRQQVGMATVVFQLEQKAMFGQLTSRPRLYLICVKDSLLKAAGCTDEDFESIARLLMEKLITQPRVDLDSVLLHDDSALIVEQHAALAAMPAKKHRKVIGQWAAKHCRTFAESGSEWWAPSGFRASDASERFPGLLALSPRQLDLLERYNLKLPMPSPGVLDVNPSIGFGGAVAPNAAPCLCSTSMLYLTRRGRLAPGVEHLRLVGFFGDLATMSKFPSALLRDLAGNAFDGASYLAAWCVTYGVLAELHHRRSRGTRRGQRKLTSVFDSVWGSVADGASDSD